MWLFFQFVTHLPPTIPRLSLSPILFARCVRVVCAFRLPMINHALNPTLHASPRHRPCRLPARPSVSCASPILVCGPSGHWICFALVFPLPSIDTSTTQLDPLSPLSVSTWCALASWLPFPSPSPTHAHAPPQRTHAPRRAHTMLFLVGLVGPCWPPAVWCVVFCCPSFGLAVPLDFLARGGARPHGRAHSLSWQASASGTVVCWIVLVVGFRFFRFLCTRAVTQVGSTHTHTTRTLQSP